MLVFRLSSESLLSSVPKSRVPVATAVAAAAAPYPHPSTNCDKLNSGCNTPDFPYLHKGVVSLRYVIF